MGQEFKKAIFFIILFELLAVAVFAQDIHDDKASSQSLEMIEFRMKSLSRSLSALPEPPRLNQKINLPGYIPETQNKKTEIK